MNVRKSLSLLSPADLVSIVFLLFLIGLNLVFFSRVPQWCELAAINLAVIALIFFLAWGAKEKKTRLLVGLHRWYCYLIIIFVFKEIYLMVHPIHPTDYDQVLIAIDHWVFGVHPTQWIGQFAHPVLTEILQIAYFSYYILFIILGVEIYRRYAIEAFDKAAFMIVYGFYLSYLGYFSLPGVGPRFTLHDFALLETELPGILLTNTLRAIINAGESIPQIHDHAIDVVQRDVFPSGHTQLTMIVIALGFRYTLKTRWVLLAFGTLLILATVYLRYHYVVDLVAGALLAWFTFWTGDKLEVWWSGTTTRLRGGEELT
ncbi:MAG: phosphatase PAP2 family protein [Ignavibacteriales bacterium]|nr:phosphatase PAP2 family protein [Ignavibacteriales bacterium]